MKDTVCLVTGANAGIGLETARGLAHLGATVVMVCRNEQRGNKALTDIQSETDNANLHLLFADLSSQKQIDAMANDFLGRFDRLDVLINNAGVFLPRLELTEDGIESTFAINHLAYFLLAHRLLDILKQTPQTRIINVSSNAHRSGKIDFNSFEGKNGYNGFAAYAQSKLANVLFTYEFARRFGDTGISCNALHPGVVATNIARHGFSFFTIFFRLFSPFFLRPASGALTSLHVATSTELAGVTGKYFDDQKEVRSSLLSYDTDLAQSLWEKSCTMTGITS